jgi:hypothetical protein
MPDRDLRILRALRLWALLLFAGHAGAQPAVGEAPQIGQVSRDSVWVPTPERVIRRMLQMADTTSRDLVIDLGAGDGRIPVYAAKHFGARAVGVELEANLVRVARNAAAAQSVSHLASFVQQDLFEYDLSAATVVALYISPGVMTRLKPRLAALRPGTRVVSHYFMLDDWEPDESIRVDGRSAHLWVVPAAARGTWAVEIPGEGFTVRIDQRYQKLATTGTREGRDIPVIGAQLRGSEIRFTSFDRDGSSRHFDGVIEGARMSGESQGEGIPRLPWSARAVAQ